MNYVSAQYLIEKGFSKEESRRLINKARSVMELEKYYIPFTRPKLALKTIVNKVLRGDYNETT